MVTLRELVKTGLRSRGWELSRVSDGNAARRRRLVDDLGVENVIDVGANVGQYARGLRAVGYQGDIVSFEPLPAAFEELNASCSLDDRWTAHNLALGEAEGTVEFNVSRDGVCSSALAPTRTLRDAIPQSESVDRIVVPVRRLEDFAPQGTALLKIDTQGFEHQVLAGAGRLMDTVQILDIEMALTELYEGGSSVYTLLPQLREQGFRVLSIENGFVDPTTRQTLDVDVLMVRA